MAEVLEQRHETARLRIFFLLFEQAFASSPGRLVKPLAEFLAKRPGLDYTKAEVKSWITHYRGRAMHADRRPPLSEADVRPIIDRVLLAGYEVLVNKMTWGTADVGRRDAGRRSPGRSIAMDGGSFFSTARPPWSARFSTCSTPTSCPLSAGPCCVGRRVLAAAESDEDQRSPGPCRGRPRGAPRRYRREAVRAPNGLRQIQIEGSDQLDSEQLTGIKRPLSPGHLHRIIRAIHLSGEGRVCASPDRRSALPAVAGRVLVVVRHGRGLPGLPGVASLAGGLRVHGLRPRRRVAARRRAVDVPRVPFADVADRGHDLRSHAHAADGLVHGLLAVRHAKGRDLRARAAARAGDRLLPDGVGDAHRLRSVLVRPGRELLQGRVEVDETHIGGKSRVSPAAARRARRRWSASPLSASSPRAWGIVAWRGCSTVQRVAARVPDRPRPAGRDGHQRRLAALPPRDQGPLRPRRVVVPGAKASDLLPGVHRIASLAQRWLLGTHQGAVEEPHPQATWMSSSFATTADAHAAAEWFSTACSNSPSPTRSATAT